MDITIALGSLIFSIIRPLSAIWWILPIALVGYWIYLGAEAYKKHIIATSLPHTDNEVNTESSI